MSLDKIFNARTQLTAKGRKKHCVVSKTNMMKSSISATTEINSQKFANINAHWAETGQKSCPVFPS